MCVSRGRNLLATVALAAGVIASPALAVPSEAGKPESVPASPCDVLLAEAECALVPEALDNPEAESAVFVVEEAAVPFLGPTTGAGTNVQISIQAQNYDDLFTIYFPRGSDHITMPAEDMAALAAIAAQDQGEAVVWISSGASLTTDLAMGRMQAVLNVLIEYGVPLGWIHLDDGSLDAILNRPESLSSDIGL